MFSLWLSRNTIGFYIWILYFAILVSLLVLIVLHTIHSKCLYSRSCPHANRDSLISCSSGYIILLSVCGPYILLSICGPGKAHSTKPNGSRESMFPLVPPWNKAPAYRKMQEECVCHEHAISWSGSLALSLLCLEHPALTFLHRGGEVFLFLYASLNVCSRQ